MMKFTNAIDCRAFRYMCLNGTFIKVLCITCTMILFNGCMGHSFVNLYFFVKDVHKVKLDSGKWEIALLSETPFINRFNTWHDSKMLIQIMHSSFTGKSIMKMVTINSLDAHQVCHNTICANMKKAILNSETDVLLPNAMGKPCNRIKIFFRTLRFNSVEEAKVVARRYAHSDKIQFNIASNGIVTSVSVNNDDVVTISFELWSVEGKGVIAADDLM